MPRPNPRLPAAMLVTYEWQDRAACRDVNPELFFSAESERGISKLAREAVAKALCNTCPVRSECREHALRVGEPYGVWGGTTEDERDPRAVRASVAPA